jgi:threonine/homoserine/homoserine lactone efflux protein
MLDSYSLEMLFSIASFGFASALTPGPNNIMLLSSGLTFGYKRTVPHILGVMSGFTSMVICIGLGFGTIFELFPMLFTVLKVIGISYLLWMAWHIANTSGSLSIKVSNNNKPFTFLQGATFQLVNPKAWIVAITAVVSFTTAAHIAFTQVLIIAFIFLIAGSIACNSWTIGGVYLNKLIKNERRIKIFNVCMAILIVASVLPFMFE